MTSPPRHDALFAPARTKSDLAYQVLRRAIVSGQIGANHPLDEKAVMAAFQIGRTPMREALKRLAAEQFVTWPAHSTPLVRSATPEELGDLYMMRQLLEEKACRLAAPRISESSLTRLDELSAAIEHYILAGQFYEAVELDYRLHAAIADASGNRFLAQASANLNCGSLRLWFVAHERLPNQNEGTRHSALIAALRSGDSDAAAAAARQHVEQGHQRQLALLIGDDAGLEHAR